MATGKTGRPLKHLASLGWPYLAVAAAALLAHAGCLEAPFYLDDQPHILTAARIVDSSTPDAGFFHGVWDIEKDIFRPGQRALTYLLWKLVYRSAGFSSPAFHLLNLTLHALISTLVYAVALKLFSRKPIPCHIGTKPTTLALWAGLIFAVHPLCSEVTHYAAQTSIQLATLFSMLAAVCTLFWLQNRRPSWLLAVLVTMIGAAFSKEAGIFHAGINVALIYLAPNSLDWKHWRDKKQLRKIAVVAIPLLAATLWFAARQQLIYYAWHGIRSPQLGPHLLTQSRVFWEYVGRMILPLNLCSDHLIPRSVSSGDSPALFAAGCLTALLAGLVFIWIRRPALRLYALLAALSFSHLLVRFLYVFGRELMVEYRTYPSMPWVAILFALLLATLFRKKPRIANIAAALLIVILAGLCVRRSMDWQSEQHIVTSVQSQYPLHIRTLSYLQAIDYRAGRYDAVIETQQNVEQALNDILKFNGDTLRHHRQYDVTHALGGFMAGEQFVAYALIGKNQPQAAINRTTEVINTMRRLGRDDKGIGFAVLYRVRGKAKAALGDREGAREDYQKCLERKPHDPETLRLMAELQALE